MLYQVYILRLHNVLFAPMAEEFNIGHKVDIGLPVTIYALQILVDQVHYKSQLLPVASFLFREKLRVLLNDWANYFVAVRAINCQEHLVRNGQEALTVCDGRRRFHANKAAFEIARVLQLGHDDALVDAPFVENLALASMFNLPVNKFR